MDWKRLSVTSPDAESPPADEPISTAELRDHLTLEIDAADSLLEALTLRVREYTENYLHRVLITRSATMVLPHFPGRFVFLPFGKAQSLTSIAYVDTAGDAQALTSADWQTDFTDDERPVIIPARGTVWPVTDWESVSPLTISWQAGYGADPENVPGPIIQAMLLQAARWFEARWDGEAPIMADDMFHNAVGSYIIHHA